ncbi:Aldo/keto reductase [Ceratobasidium theobromae]|uniref:Aldo/keto reductase n=1 Tax=Ceratobasidium theobromae TaxID=1582974 RepID=A0A5N5QRB2_9AGAM|nr:Aldo/keto reductase [Ceratobasidium theobromae]
MGPKSAAAKTIKVALAAGFLACVYSYFFPAASVIVPTTPTVNVTMAAQQVPIIELPNAKGVKIPAIGLGTWQSKPEEVVTAVEHALKSGYRHIDCAFAYGNEAQVGEGIKKSGVPRSEIFITSKVWSTYHRRVAESLQKSLENLGTDYLDLLLMHWPVPLNPNGNHPLFPTLEDGTRDVDKEWTIAQTWAQLEELVAQGKVRAIGVSNCSELKLNEILPTAKIIPAVNQVELHPYNPQLKLVEFCKSHGIVMQAYSPLGSTDSPMLKDEVISEIAKKHDNASPAAGHVVLPKSVTPARIEANLKVVKLDGSDVEKLDSLAASGKQKRFIMPPWPVVLGFADWK